MNELWIDQTVVHTMHRVIHNSVLFGQKTDFCNSNQSTLEAANNALEYRARCLAPLRQSREAKSIAVSQSKYETAGGAGRLSVMLPP